MVELYKIRFLQLKRLNFIFVYSIFLAKFPLRNIDKLLSLYHQGRIKSAFRFSVITWLKTFV